MAEASLLARKWQDKDENFQGIRKRALELVPELGRSFEEVEEKSSPKKFKSRIETEDKGNKQAFPETTEEPRT